MLRTATEPVLREVAVRSINSVAVLIRLTRTCAARSRSIDIDPPSLMRVTDYLQQFPDDHRVQLVGPMLETADDFREPVVFVDGGAQHRRGDIGIAVGDGDSSPLPMDEKLPTDKDISDLGYALSQLPPRIRTLELLGFLGGRRDHELGNFGAVHAFLTRASHPAQASFDQAVCAYGPGEWQLHIEGRFSLIVLEPTRLSLRGNCRYPLWPAARIEPLSSHTLSNIGHGEISLTCDAPVFVFAEGVDIMTDKVTK